MRFPFVTELLSPWRPAWRREVLLLASLGCWTSGCSEELGPEDPPVAHVKGRVTEAGRPVSGGWIEFFPVDGCVGNLRSARLRPDGSFDADKVAVGLNLIRLVNTSISSAEAARLFGQYRSPIRRTIPAQPGGPVVIDLLDEALLFKSTQKRPVLPEPPKTDAKPGESR
jgi:hypothetical protein